MRADDPYECMIERARRRSEADAKGLSIEELAAGLGKSVWVPTQVEQRPDAPERVKQGRRLMYGREDVRHWLEQSRGDGGDDTLDGDESL